MESAESLQQLEMTALRSIYGNDFVEMPPPKVWKDAARLHEFSIKVPHPDPSHASKVYFHLHTKFPRTYPTAVCPTFTIQKPIEGLNNDQIATLSSALRAEAQKYKGSEMVFQIVTFAQEWVGDHISPPIEVVGSLATEMKKRAHDEEQARRQREAEEANQKHQQEARLAEELNQQILADAQRHQHAKEQQYKSRNRNSIMTTVVPSAGDTPTESFSHEIEFSGISFDTVKFFHPHKEGLGTMYLAEPVCDDITATLPLELYSVSFDTQYYSTTQGKKKLQQVEAEIRTLMGIRHPNLLSLLAVKLTTPHSNGSPQLIILSEQRPSTKLQDILEECESLREERASEYLVQILSALNAVHAANLVHRGINLRCIGLASRDQSALSKVVKLDQVGYYTRLLDLHRSNPFALNFAVINDEIHLPEAWLSEDAVESPLLYTRSRDLHGVGIVLLQMLLGYDVTEKFMDPHTALQSPSVAPELLHMAGNMLLRNKKNQLSCSMLLTDLVDSPFRTPSRTPMIPIPDAKTPMFPNYGSSPEIDYFQRTRHASRWKEDWEELELLGRGAFGSVVKARNKIDSRIYAVKKILLRTMKSDSKIFREVIALSRLSHRFIVRYYTTWVETSERMSTPASDDFDMVAWTDDGMTSVPQSRKGELSSSDPLSFHLEDLDDFGSGSNSTFPSIHFARSSTPKTDDDDDSDDAFENSSRPETPATAKYQLSTPPQQLSRTLYIQMEFVERQTLKERVAEGLSENEAWRLFHQILDALVHMSGLGILHRDIKLTNIFIDGKGDCKVGDFGLATSSLAAVDPSDLSPQSAISDGDMTLEVGTKLYIAPEVRSQKRGPGIHMKADLYSLGVVFFEMNYAFSTGSERIAVIENLRRPEVLFPSDWNPLFSRQRKIITWLLQHDPAKRPAALELSQSPLLPPRLEDEYFNSALRLMSKPDSPHHQLVLSSLFDQPPRPARGYLFDLEAELPDHAHLNSIVQERLVAIFRLHGAVDMEPPLLMPVMRPDDKKTQATFLDRHGDVVMLPDNTLIPFARLAARKNLRRIKRYHITDIYRPNIVAGHPKVTKAAVFDIITPDLATGHLAAGAEVLAIANECLHTFPTLAQNYEVHISHSKLVALALDRIPNELRATTIEIISQTKPTSSQKRALLLKNGLLKSTADELEALADIDADIDAFLSKSEKVSPALADLVRPFAHEVKMIIQHANLMGITTVYFHPLMLGNHHTHFSGGIRFEVVKRSKRTDVLAAGGQYDDLISRFSPPTAQSEAVCSVGVQIAIEKITAALASFQSSSVKTLVKEQRSFGFWSPRRCDVYVVSYHPGYLQDRLEVVSYLWQHNISADIMYESGLPDTEHENHVDICSREGILFTVYPRPRFARRDQAAFKVKSILKGTEYEISRQELIGWLQHEIAEQKRIDLSTSGAALFSDNPQSQLSNKDFSVSPDVQLLLSTDSKKQRKQIKHGYLDRAFEAATQVKTAFQAGMPILAIDVAPPIFDAMTRNSAWISDDDAWRPILSAFPTSQAAYASQVRDAAAKRKADHRFLLLFAVKEGNVQLLAL